jgi:signal transduction histidine kinase
MKTIFRYKTSLTQKLFAYYLFICLATIFILSVYSYFSAKNALISRTYDQLTSVRFEKIQSLNRYYEMKKSNQDSTFTEKDLESINSLMFNTNPRNGLGKTGEAYLVDSTFQMLTSSRFKEKQNPSIIVKTNATRDAFSGISGTNEYLDYRNVRVFGSYSPLEISNNKWAVIAEIDVEEAMVSIYTLRNSIILLSIVVSLFIFVLVYIISRRISLPVIKLKQAAEIIASGNYSVHIENDSNDEIGELTDAFNKMSEKIEIQTQELKHEKAKQITSMIDGQESERQRLSRELHDGLGQYILATKMKLERYENAYPELKKQIVEEAKNLLATISKEVVSMSENLAPPVLNQFGLISAIENICEEVGKNSGIKIEFTHNAEEKKCDEKVKIYLYRIIQEALNNILKHSKATEVKITLNFSDQINLLISDNGVGFSFDENYKAGNGISNMRERTELLGGTFEIIQDNGTTIKINI